MGTRTLKQDDAAAKRYEDLRKANLTKPEQKIPDKKTAAQKPTEG